MGLTTWTKKAQADRLELVEKYRECKAAGYHEEFRSDLCVNCGIGRTPHRECIDHGPFLNGKCRTCGQADNPLLSFVEEVPA